jgi:hypothetical protein
MICMSKLDEHWPLDFFYDGIIMIVLCNLLEI